MIVVSTAHGTYVYSQAAGRPVWVPAGTAHTTLTPAMLAQMRNPSLWTGEPPAEATAPAPGTLTSSTLRRVEVISTAEHQALVDAGTADNDTLYVRTP